MGNLLAPLQCLDALLPDLFVHLRPDSVELAVQIAELLLVCA